jgi:hypothetical protein
LSIALFLQSVKVLELLCRREAKAVFEADGLQCLLTFVNTNGHNVHKDTLQCSLSVQLHPTSHIAASVVSYLPPSSWGMCGEV